MMIGSVALWPKIPLLPHKWPKLNYSRNSGSKISCFSSFLRGKILDGSTESQFAAVGSIVAHFTTLGAWKYMYRATRICINFLPNSNYEATRAQSKRGTKMIESEEVFANIFLEWALCETMFLGTGPRSVREGLHKWEGWRARDKLARPCPWSM